MSREIDRAALVWGAVFTIVGVTYLLQEVGVWRVRASVLLPAALVVAGVALVASALGSKDER